MNVVTTGIVLETVAGWFCSCASVPNVYRFSFCIHPIYIYNNSIREFAYTMILSRDHCYSLSRDIYISAALVFMSMNATKSTLIACPSWLSYLLIMPSCGESHSIEANRPFFRARQLPFLRWTRHSWDELAIPEIYSPFLRWTRHSWDELAIPEMNSPFFQRDILAIPSESRIHSVSTIPIIIEQRFAPLHTKGRLERASVLPNSFSPTNPPSRFTERYRNVHRGESLCSSDQAGQGRVDRHAKLPAETSGCIPSPHR